MTHFTARSFFIVGLLVWCTGFALAQDAKNTPTPPEPGQTPRPKPDGPVTLPSEADSVKLDSTLPPFFAIADDAPFRFRGKELSLAGAEKATEELKAYEYTVEFVASKPPELLKKYANKKVPWTNLFGEIRKDYLWELLHFEGKLIYLQPFKSTDRLQKIEGLGELYEAWIYPKGATELVCLVVVDLPAGVQTGENLNLWVSFDAYYFKFMRYESRQLKPKEVASDDAKHQWRRAPLFIGRTFEVIDLQPVETSFFSGTLFYTVVGGLLVLVGVGAALSYWFRMGDKAIKEASQRRIQEGVRFDVEPTAEPERREESKPAGEQPPP